MGLLVRCAEFAASRSGALLLFPGLVAACGLDWNEACLARHRNARRITTPSVWQARPPIYRTSVERWRRYEPWLGELRELAPNVR